MDARKYSVLILFLIIVLCANLTNIQMVHADDETPTEPSAPTQVETEPTTEPVAAETTPLTELAVVEREPTTESAVEVTEFPTEAPVVETPIPEESPAVSEEATETPVAEVLSQVPENTEVVILDENGDSIPLVTQEAAEIMEMTDPMWCPAGVLPGSSGCSSSFGTIAALTVDMRSNPSFYAEAGIIYFTSSANGSLVLTNQGGSLGTAYDILKNYELTLQGGWNGETGAGFSLTGEQTNFANNRITIGTSANPWVGNLTLNDLAFSGGNTMLLTIYTTEGDITLNNVDITGQTNSYAAGLDSDLGDITVQNSNFAGSPGTQSRGFYANTGGRISVSDTSFTGAGTRNTSRYNGATLNAPIVTLANVSASDNAGSGVFVTGLRLIIIGGRFVNNQRYGVEVASPASTTIYIRSDPNCTGNGLSCYNDTTIFDNTPPVIAPIVNGAMDVKSWYSSDVTVSWSVTDGESGILSSSGCDTTNLTAETADTTLTCSATNNADLSNSASVTIRIDKSIPVITPAIAGIEVNGWYGGDVTVSWSVTDGESGILSSNGCDTTNLTAETVGTTLTCSATNNAGLSNSASVTIKIDKTGPVLNSSNITAEATDPAGAAVRYSVSAIDAVDGLISTVSCLPASGFTFPLGSTTVTCSASDLRGNTSTESFDVTVNDSTAPSIEPLAGIIDSTYHRFGKHVSYSNPATSDLVDGMGVATCSPASGSLFPIGDMQVTCTATDAHGNRATSTFVIHINYETTLPVPDAPTSPTLIIPVTNNDRLIDLDSSSAFWAFGVKISYINLGDQQTVVHEVNAKNLPAELPDGFSLVMGVSVDVLTDGRLLRELPKGSSLQMGFPLAGGAKNQFAILYWNGSEWIKISEQTGGGQLPRLFSVIADKPGIFVLVKK